MFPVFRLKNKSVKREKQLYFLGSSVTKGFAAHNNSFAEYIAKKDSCTCIKEAVNGTTLIDNGEDSYIERMRDKLDPKQQVDLFYLPAVHERCNTQQPAR